MMKVGKPFRRIAGVLGHLFHTIGYRRRFAILLGICVVATAVSATYFVRFLFKPVTGLVMNYPEVVYRDGSVVFSPRTPLSPAVASGLKPGIDVGQNRFAESQPGMNTIDWRLS